MLGKSSKFLNLTNIFIKRSTKMVLIDKIKKKPTFLNLPKYNIGGVFTSHIAIGAVVQMVQKLRVLGLMTSLTGLSNLKKKDTKNLKPTVKNSCVVWKHPKRQENLHNLFLPN